MNYIPDAVLFACNMNAVRSAMAESILKHLHGHQVYVDSAGVRQGEPDHFAIEIMEEVGIDLSGHKPKRLRDLEDTSYDLIVTLSPEAQHHAIEGATKSEYLSFAHDQVCALESIAQKPQQ